MKALRAIENHDLLEPYPGTPEDEPTPIDAADLMVRRSLFSLAARTRSLVFVMMSMCLASLGINAYLAYYLTITLQPGRDRQRATADSTQRSVDEVRDRGRQQAGVVPDMR